MLAVSEDLMDPCLLAATRPQTILLVGNSTAFFPLKYHSKRYYFASYSVPTIFWPCIDFSSVVYSCFSGGPSAGTAGELIALLFCFLLYYMICYCASYCADLFPMFSVGCSVSSIPTHGLLFWPYFYYFVIQQLALLLLSRLSVTARILLRC